MNETMFMRILERMPGAVSMARLDPATGTTEALYLSPRAREIYGATEAELKQLDVAALGRRIVPEDAGALGEQYAEVMKTLAPMSWCGRVKHESGELRWIEIQSFAEREPQGTILLYTHAFDATARRRTEDALLASEAARRKSDTLHRAVIEALPVGVCVMDTEGGFPIVNAAQMKMSGQYDDEKEEERGDGLMKKRGMFLADGITPMPMSEAPVAIAITGQEADDIELVVRNRYIEGEVRMLSQGRPIRDESGKIIAAVAVCVDITAQRALERELVTRNEQLAASEESKTVLIERLRAAVDELSNPILEVWDDVLAMPIIGVVDSRRTADMVRRLLAEVARTQASFVIVDLTGVEIVDTKTADHLMKLMRKVEIVGARCVLTGVRPAVAETLVDIGVDFGRLATLRNLKHGLREALRHARREREGLRDIGGDEDSSGRLGAAATRALTNQG